MEKNITDREATPEPSTSPQLLEREFIKMEFYKTYDVMTGVRIAATLGSFFSIMVLLVVYKSKCKSRSVSSEDLEAAAAAAAAAEQHLLHREGAYSVCGNGVRHSLGHAPTPPDTYWLPRPSLPSPLLYPCPLFQSIGLGSPPPKSYKRDDKEREAAGDWLQVRWPGTGEASRRHSSLTNSSFYLDRRGSLMDMPFSVTPFLPHGDYLLEEPPLYNLINIQVTNPTPEMSPCISRDSVYDVSCRKERLSIPKVAPLASVGSIGLPSTEQDNHSVGSDSVFLDEELIDTEDEVEGFSTDSDGENINPPFVSGNQNPHNQLKSQSLDSQRNNRVSQRRFSFPSPLGVQDNQSRTLSPSALLKESLKVLTKNHKVSSDSETIHINAEGGFKKGSRNASSPTNMSASCGQLVRALQAFNSGTEPRHTAPGQDCWSRETLF